MNLNFYQFKFRIATTREVIRGSQVYWTRQHGAYITLITSWIIAIIVTGFSMMQFPAIIFLLSAVNVTELLVEKMNRKSPMPVYKNSWLNTYGIITIVTGILLLLYSDTFRELILFLTAGAMIFIALARNKYQKSLPAELLTFSIFVVSAFTGSIVEDWREVFTAIAIMILFFGTSIFTVKQRFERVNILAVIIYTLIAITITLLITQSSLFGIAISILMILKTSPSWAFQKQFHKLKIKQVGMLEALFQLILVGIFIALYE